jgi:hypothetical protein
MFSLFFGAFFGLSPIFLGHNPLRIDPALWTDDAIIEQI